ncbi:MAG: hypothetical protein ACI4EG_10740 [Fusicatenibacter sp.]|nr:hypothetical protein [Fusicatenibacter sp.]
MARKRYNYNFIRKQSRGGKDALWMAGCSFFLFLLDAVISFAFRGNGGMILGAIGIFAILLSAYGFYVGMKSFQEDQVSHRLSAAGSISCGGVFLIWLSLLLVGI